MDSNAIAAVSGDFPKGAHWPAPSIPVVHTPVQLTDTHGVVAGGIGDVNGTEPGSGARFNEGKLRVDLLPLSVVIDALNGPVPCAEASRSPEGIQYLLGRWQDTGDADYLVTAFRYSCGASKYWSFQCLKDCIAVLEYGSKKYASWNWARGMPWSVSYACALRHLDALIRLEEYDPESGYKHMGHVAANILFLLVYVKRYPELNDMPFGVLKAPCGI